MTLDKLQEYYEKLKKWHISKDGITAELWIVEDLRKIMDGIPVISSADSDTMITAGMSDEEINKRLETAAERFETSIKVTGTHQLKNIQYYFKVWKGWYQHMLDGRKTFDARRRHTVENLKAGDKVCFQEYDQDTNRQTSRRFIARVLFITYTRNFNFWPDRVEALEKADLAIFSFRVIWVEEAFREEESE